MKLVLMSPAGTMYRCSSGSFKKALRYAPLTLSTLAALVPDELDVEIEIIDEGVQRLPEHIEADLVGISAITGTASRSYRIADRLRELGIPVVLGGVHPTIMPQEASSHADSIVTGFAEETWPALLRDFTNGGMRKVYSQSPDLSLAGTPAPRRDLLRRKLYLTMNSVQATRGCVHECDFCVIPGAWGTTQLFRPVEDVVAEIASLKGRYVTFLDPSPTENIDYAKDLFRAMIPLRKIWFGLSTVKIAEDPELLDLCAKSGCRGLLLGFESLLQEGLDDISKDFNLAETYGEVARKLHDRGIAIQGCFVFGFDTDDPSVFERTVEFVNESNIDLPRYAVCTPFPGTDLYKKWKAEGRILTEDWSLYDSQHVVYRPARMSPEELREKLLWAWSETYRPGACARRVMRSGCTPLVSAIANIGYRAYAKNLARFPNEVVSESADGELTFTAGRPS
jgi:radical SAM superfamily enzyme YgiQ (UPF0313 family)